MSTLKMGILGTAKIAPWAFIGPAREVEDVEVLAIASRDLERAKQFAEKNEIPGYYGSYEELLENLEINAVYIPLPNGIHAEWSIKALKAGKHVLCEKPLASNAEEAQAMKDVADETGLNLTEALHYRYHPLPAQLKQLARSGEIGDVERVEASWGSKMGENNIRFDYDLAGGITMDYGCYLVNFLRFFTDEEPEVTNAIAEVFGEQIDTHMVADLAFPGGLAGHVESSFSTNIPEMIRIIGTEGELKCEHPFLPFTGAKLEIIKGVETTRVIVDKGVTWEYQMKAFASAIANGTPPLTGAADAVKNMHVIDAIYEKAGLKIRGIKE